MSCETPQLDSVRMLCAGAELMTEAGKKVVFLPAMKIEGADGVVEQDLLFVPFSHSGYPSSRLFFSSVVRGKAKNWTQHVLLNRRWHAPSYKVDMSLSWRDQLLQHLQAVT